MKNSEHHYGRLRIKKATLRVPTPVAPFVFVFEWKRPVTRTYVQEQRREHWCFVVWAIDVYIKERKYSMWWHNKEGKLLLTEPWTEETN